MLSNNSPAMRLVTLIAICGLLFFAFLGIRDLWDIDEGMHAAIAQTMLLSGDWVTPVFNGEPFFDKPVLFNWLNAISFKVFGFTEVAAGPLVRSSYRADALYAGENIPGAAGRQAAEARE